MLNSGKKFRATKKLYSNSCVVRNKNFWTKQKNITPPHIQQTAAKANKSFMFYQKKSKSTITNNKRTSISNPYKTQIRILLHCLGSSHKRKHQLARKGTATGSQVYMQQTS
jgi:hypothetical protein